MYNALCTCSYLMEEPVYSTHLLDQNMHGVKYIVLSACKILQKVTGPSWVSRVVYVTKVLLSRIDDV